MIRLVFVREPNLGHRYQGQVPYIVLLLAKNEQMRKAFHNLIGAHFRLHRKPGFAGLSNCRVAAITAGVLPEAKLPGLSTAPL
jgi:hypothetical protein